MLFCLLYSSSIEAKFKTPEEYIVGRFFDKNKVVNLIQYSKFNTKKHDPQDAYIKLYLIDGEVVPGSEAVLYNKNNAVIFSGIASKSGNSIIIKGEGNLGVSDSFFGNWLLGKNHDIKNSDNDIIDFFKGEIMLSLPEQNNFIDYDKFPYRKVNLLLPFTQMTKTYTFSSNDYDVYNLKWTSTDKGYYTVEYRLPYNHPIMLFDKSIIIYSTVPYDKYYTDYYVWGKRENGDYLRWNDFIPRVEKSIIKEWKFGYNDDDYDNSEYIFYNGEYRYSNNDVIRGKIIIYPDDVLTSVNDGNYTKLNNGKVLTGNDAGKLWYYKPDTFQKQSKNPTELYDNYHAALKEEENILNQKYKKKIAIAEGLQDKMYAKYGKDYVLNVIKNGIQIGMNIDFVDDYIQLMTFTTAIGFEKFSDSMNGSNTFSSNLEDYSIDKHYKLSYEDPTQKKYIKRHESAIYPLPKMIVFMNNKVYSISK